MDIIIPLYIINILYIIIIALIIKTDFNKYKKNKKRINLFWIIIMSMIEIFCITNITTLII